MIKYQYQLEIFAKEYLKKNNKNKIFNLLIIILMY